jgi:hypothetical protein
VPAITHSLRYAAVLALGLAAVGCRPDADGAAVSAADGETTPIYRLAVVRSHAVVVVLESTGPVDAVGVGVEIAVGRAGMRGFGAGPVLEEADVARIAGGRLQPVRTTEPPAPLGDCVSVTPWSGADSFVGVAYVDPAEPDARLTQIVLRYPDAEAAAGGALRVRHQFEDCPDGRARERRLPHGAGEVFVGIRLGPGA